MVGMDSFISDEEEDLCPLCIEEMDISDRNFRPCPCGYQICQFCYNNIKQNPELNGRCPACRRIYDDESVEYKNLTTEDLRRDRQNRKEKERKQREKERKELEQPSTKKHLSGMRVIQKNLVYVIGLNPNIPTDELHDTLRSDQFFGQFGKIQKIVINKRTNASGNPGIGVYVTFARKDDAERCIEAVDGSVNDGKYLRAAYGTTKYCSSYLRGQACPNPNCMFLHEPGEDADSYTRRDLSAMQHRQNHSANPAGASAPPNHHAPPGLPSLTAAAHSAGASVAHSGFNGHQSSQVPAHAYSGVAGPGSAGNRTPSHTGIGGASSPAPTQAPHSEGGILSSSLGTTVPTSNTPAPVTAAPLPAASAWGKPVMRAKPAVSLPTAAVPAPPGLARPSSAAAATAAPPTAATAAPAAVPSPVSSAPTAAASGAPARPSGDASSAFRALNKSFNCMAKGAVGFVFSSHLLTEEDLHADHDLPGYFSLALTEEGRLSVYSEFKEIAEWTPPATPAQSAAVLGLTGRTMSPVGRAGTPQINLGMGALNQTPSPIQPGAAAAVAAAAGVRGTPSPAPGMTPPPGLGVNAQNSQDLLAHLLKGKPSSQSVY